ncbi:MAG: sulfite exporter TauE/SafE family protein [Alphaproteobacteria bacterium]|nr:sulfite exporter TauE/SafE family protein [Alphaproteobacteria bacterium]
MIFLSVLFFITAFLYACVGFGGGSTYNALLVLNETDYKIIPLIALICNLIVVSGGVYRFSRNRHIQIKKVLPWVALSVPAAWVGGRINVHEAAFIGILGGALFVSSMKMLWPEKTKHLLNRGTKHLSSSIAILPPVLGGGLGFIAGITGIGGGIFLAPILHVLNWDNSKNIAGTCSFFILVNSLAGLTGQFMKLEEFTLLLPILSYWAMFPAVLMGGQIGSMIGAERLNTEIIKKMTALLILYVALKLLFRFFEMSDLF